MHKRMAVVGAMLLGGCADEAAAPPAAPATLPGGQWEVTASVTAVEGKGAASAAHKAGDKWTGRACVAEGIAPVNLFAAQGETCETQAPYLRGGRINMQMNCTRRGSSATVMADVAGTYTADTLKGESQVVTFVGGKESQRVKHTLAGRRLGACGAGAGA